MIRLSDRTSDGSRGSVMPDGGAHQTPPVQPRPPQQSVSGRPPFDLEALYAKLTAIVRSLFDQARARQPLALPEAVRALDDLPQMKTERCEAILSLVERHTEENYLYSHSVNVALLAYHLSLCLGYAFASARQLALAGLLHDIGMAGEAEAIIAAPRKLTTEEWKVISRHPAEAVERLKEAHGLSRKALEAIGQHHPHLAGQGAGPPPRRLPGTLSEYAKILSVCDVYDALTHPRTYRKRFSPAQAIKTLIDGIDDQFDRRVVNALVDELSLYPKGSVVKLNTNEIGTVEHVHTEAPLRPVVLVSRDVNRQPLATPRVVNLLERPFLYIKEIVSEEQA